jgi:hypothetical protein
MFDELPFFYFVQAIGILAMLICVLRHQFDNIKVILRMGATSGSLFAIQMVMLGNPAGAIICFLDAFRAATMSTDMGQDHKWKFIPVIAVTGLILGFAVSGFGWQSVVLLFPFITIYAEMHNSAKIYRRAILISASCWIVYSFFTGSYGLILASGFSFVSCLIALWRFEFKELPAQKQQLA